MNYIPSMYAHIINGVALFAGIIYLALYFPKVISRDPYQILVLILLFSIAIGIHGISHMGMETVYNYNPLMLFTGGPIEPYHPIDCPYRKKCNCPYFKNNETCMPD